MEAAIAVNYGALPRLKTSYRVIKHAIYQGQLIDPFHQSCCGGISHNADCPPKETAVFEIVIDRSLLLLLSKVWFLLIAVMQVAVLLVLFIPAAEHSSAGIAELSDTCHNAVAVLDIELYRPHTVLIRIHGHPPDCSGPGFCPHVFLRYA